MDQKTKQIVKRILLAITSVEKQVFFFTGILLPLLALRFKAEAQSIQSALDAQHITVSVPTINVEEA